jgi:hypothetical protein
MRNVLQLFLFCGKQLPCRAMDTYIPSEIALPILLSKLVSSPKVTIVLSHSHLMISRSSSLVKHMETHKHEKVNIGVFSHHYYVTGPLEGNRERPWPKKHCSVFGGIEQRTPPIVRRATMPMSP